MKKQIEHQFARESETGIEPEFLRTAEFFDLERAERGIVPPGVAESLDTEVPAVLDIPPDIPMEAETIDDNLADSEAFTHST